MHNHKSDSHLYACDAWRLRPVIPDCGSKTDPDRSGTTQGVVDASYKCLPLRHMHVTADDIVRPLSVAVTS